MVFKPVEATCDLVMAARKEEGIAKVTEKDLGCVGFAASNTGPTPAKDALKTGPGLDLVVCAVRAIRVVGFLRPVGMPFWSHLSVYPHCVASTIRRCWLR